MKRTETIKQNVRRIFAARALLFLTILVLLPVRLSLPSSAAASAALSIRAIIPENQVDKRKTYYDLRLEPGQKQTIQLSVRNGSDDEAVANISLYSASTGRGGLIQYSPQETWDESLLLPVTEIAEVVTPRVTLPAKGEAVVDIELRMPEQAFDGWILGGLVVTAEQQEAEASALTTENVRISNEYAYVVGLQITQSESEVRPDLRLRSIRPGLVNYRPVVAVNLQNYEAAIIKGMRIDAQVYRGTNTEPYRQMSMSDVDMAPNSNFDVAIEWENRPLEPGDYRLAMRAEHQDQVWEWDEGFTIEGKEAGEVNTSSPYIEPRRPLWLYVAGGSVLLLLVFLLAFWLGRRKRREAE